MYFSLSNFTYGALAAMACLTFAQAATANDLTPSVSEEFIRDTFSFAENETLKFSECTDKTHPTCTYIWGSPHKKDEARLNAGVAPEGSKLMIVFAKGYRAENFEKVTAVYSDAEPIDDLGIAAVWSPKRHQLSLMTETFLIMHVNIEDSENTNSSAVAVDIANHILAGQ